jgi:predicted deacylase
MNLGVHIFAQSVPMLCMLVFGAFPARGETRTVTYLENSDHELAIYFIDGKEPGKTMLIMGGIQGDEPGGYLAADLYADLHLEKGNLIVVPRTNFFSIRKNLRGVYGDMNRKFGNTSPGEDDDARIIGILHSLMEKSDVLLNLHEGSGFYSSEYISEIRNPMRFGQCIIADTALYMRPDGKTVDLREPALRVIEDINENIRESEHRFSFNNHDTFSETSPHKEQRKSATFHALTVVGIPAFGIETSKDIPSIETKVRYETLAINAFMKEYGIIPEHPSISLPTPQLDHMVINVMGNPVPFAVKNGATFSVPAGTSIQVMSIVANYQRGLSPDIVGTGNSNDLNRITVINTSTDIKVYKDAYQCGEVHVDIIPPKAQEKVPDVRVSAPVSVRRFEIRVSGKNMVVSSGDTLHIIRGDFIEVVDVETSGGLKSGVRVNFVGFVGNEKVNDAEDRGYPIDTAADLMKRFSSDGDGRYYRIEALSGQRVIGTMYVKLDEPRVDYLIVERSDGTKLAFSPNADIRLSRPDTLRILSVVSNVTDAPFVTLAVPGGDDRFRECAFPTILEVNNTTNVQFRRNGYEIGSLSFRIDK